MIISEYSGAVPSSAPGTLFDMNVMEDVHVKMKGRATQTLICNESARLSNDFRFGWQTQRISILNFPNFLNGHKYFLRIPGMLLTLLPTEHRYIANGRILFDHGNSTHTDIHVLET